MTVRRLLQALIAALLTTFALMAVAPPGTAASSTFTITGVASLDGKGVAGITAHLLQSDTEGDSYEHYGNAVTNSKGSYTFSKVPTGSADGYSYVMVFTDSTHKVVTEERYLVPKAGKPVTRNVTLERAATLSGTLSRQDGTPPHNITAHIIGSRIYEPRDNGVDRYNDPIVRHVHSNGSYEFVGLPAGTYRVQFSDDSQKYLDQCYDNTVAGLRDSHYPECSAEITPASTAVTVSGGQKSTLNPQTMTHRANHISGTVKDTAGNALKDVEIVAFPNGDGTTNGPAWSSDSDSSGNFNVAGLPAGGWQLRAESTSNLWAPQWYDRRLSQDGSTVLNVGPDDVSGVTITMLSRSILKATATAGTKSATFQVLTTRKAGGPRPGGSVTVHQGSKTSTGDLVNGRATIKLTNLTPGKRTITVTYSGNATTAGTSTSVVVMVKA